MKTCPRRRGEPALALVLILGGWTAARAVLWEPLGQVISDASHIFPAALASHLAQKSDPPAPLAHQTEARQAVIKRLKSAAQPLETVVDMALNISSPNVLGAVKSASMPQLGVLLPDSTLSSRPSAVATPIAMAGAHQLLWLAAMSNMPLPPGFAPETRGNWSTNTPTANTALIPPSASDKSPNSNLPNAGLMQRPPNGKTTSARSHWSADGWLMWRQASGGAGPLAVGAPSGGLPSYGASQMGAVIRYRLRNSALAPTAYLRGTAALTGFGKASGERGLAVGLSLRPIKALPIMLAAEARADHFAGGATYLRPAVSVISAINPISLPLSSRAEFYAQAGYVGGGTAGSQAATAFADGQLRVDHRFEQNRFGDLRAGIGVWGGAQRGTTRLDIGPSATLIHAGSGAASARLAVDYRFRILGNAAPASGAAITLSAGF